MEICFLVWVVINDKGFGLLAFSSVLFLSGRDGLTHNMLDNIHAHWKRRRVCKIKCKGVCTVDMDNVKEQLEVGSFCRYSSEAAISFLCMISYSRQKYHFS